MTKIGISKHSKGNGYYAIWLITIGSASQITEVQHMKEAKVIAQEWAKDYSCEVVKLGPNYSGNGILN